MLKDSEDKVETVEECTALDPAFLCLSLAFKQFGGRELYRVLSVKRAGV